MRALAGASWSAPPLDAALLDTYFQAFIDAGDIPRPAPSTTPPSRAGSLTLDAAFFSRVTGLGVTAAHRLGSGSDHSIVSELAGWRSGRATGLFRFRLEIATAAGRRCRDVVAKLKPRDADVIETGQALAAMCDPPVGVQYARWRDRLGMTGAHERELAIYRQTDSRFVTHAPEVLATLCDPAQETWLVVLEQISDAALMDSVERPHAWTPPRLAVAIDGLADLHAIWLGRDHELAAASWIGHVPTTGSMAEMADLWEALAEHAAPSFGTWAGADLPVVHRRLARNAGRWWPALERGDRTLIHHDFNPRNICLRGAGRRRRLCAYDWELATIGAPQRDLAELLCFVLPPDVARDEARIWIDRHREQLVRASGRRIDAVEWQSGFAAALGDLLVNRLATYALIHRVRPQRFLPRLVRTWTRLHALFPLVEDR
jgi:hypothetical protein